MKYIKPKLIFVFVLLFVFLALPAFADMKNEPKGYGGFKWNTSAKNFFGKYRKNLIMFNDTGIFEIFKNKQESETFEGVKEIKVKNVMYYFNKSDGFSLAGMDFDATKADFQKLMKYCTSKWGKPDEMVDIENRNWLGHFGSTWRGKKTFAEIRGKMYNSKEDSVYGKIFIGLKEFDGYI